MRHIGWKRCFDPAGRLRDLSAWELVEAQQEAQWMTPSDEAFGLCLNACVLARSLTRRGRQRFPSGEALMRAMPEKELRRLTEQYLARCAGEEPAADAVNPAFDEARFEELRRT